MRARHLIDTIHSLGGIKIEIWSDDFEHAISGHPEVNLEKVKTTLMDPWKIIKSVNSKNACLFYSVKVRGHHGQVLFFCVVVAVSVVGRGRMITAYDADFVKMGAELYSKGDASES